MIYRVLKCISWLCQLCSLAFSKGKVRYVLIGTPEHGNLGDHAIALAEIQLFRGLGLKHCEVTEGNYRWNSWIIRFFLTERDILCITGGGFLGSLWKLEDTMTRSVIALFPKNKIIIFPQSVFFEDTANGDAMEFSRAFSHHKNLHLFLREKHSFAVCKRLLGDSVNLYVVPDMVLLLAAEVVRQKRTSVLMCFRDDKERLSGMVAKQNTILQLMQKQNMPYSEITTKLHRGISTFTRKRELRKLLHLFSSGTCVVTDRLHAMLFSYLTETPCYAYDNLSRKVSGVYEWIADSRFVQCEKPLGEIAMGENLTRGVRRDFSKEFQPLFAVLEYRA